MQHCPSLARDPASAVRLLQTPKAVSSSRRVAPTRPRAALSDVPFKVIDGKTYISLSGAQKFFDKGLKEGTIERLKLIGQQLELAIEDREKLAEELEALRTMEAQEHTVHEAELKRLVEYAVALEEQVHEVQRELPQAVASAAEQTVQMMRAAFQQALQAQHEQDKAQLQAKVHAHIEDLGHALRTAVHDKESWRHRAQRAEQQFASLRSELGAAREAAAKGPRRRAA